MQSEEVKPKKKINIAGIIIYSVIALILIFVFIITLSMIISSLSGKTYTSIFGRAFFAVETDSMSKNGQYTYDVKDGELKGFEQGDLIVVKELNSGWEWELKHDDDGISYATEKSGKMTLKVGDIISYKETKNNVQIVNSHRITSVYDADGVCFTTKGDNAPAEDNSGWGLNISDVIGRYTGTNFGAIGNVVLFMQDPVGYWVVIGVPVLAILVYCIITFALAITKRNRTDIADEKERIRRQLIEELRAQGLVPNAPAAENNANNNVTADTGGQPPAAVTESSTVADKTAVTEVPAAAPEESENEWDGIPVINESDIDASIAKIQEELYASSGLAENGEGEPEEKPAAKPSSANKTASGSRGGKSGTAAVKKTTSSSGAPAKSGSAAAKTASAPAGVKKTASNETAKPSSSKSGGLAGTSANKTTKK